MSSPSLPQQASDRQHLYYAWQHTTIDSPFFFIRCLLLSVCTTAAVPEKGYLQFAVEWLDLDFVPAPFPTTPFLQAILPLIQATTGRQGLWPTEVECLRPWVQVLSTAWDRAWLSDAPAVVLSLLSGLARRCSDHRLAIAIAEKSFQDEPSFAAATSLGLARRHYRQWDAAEAAFRAAQAANPADTAVGAEIARLHWDRGQLALALEEIEQVLAASAGARDPELVLGSQFLRFKLHEDAAGAAVARAMDLSMRPDDMRLKCLPLVGFLPDPQDATIHMLAKIMDEEHRRGRSSVAPQEMLEVELSELEAPTCQLIFATHFNMPFDAPVFTVAEMSEPDPRAFKGPVDFVLWKYEGKRARRAVAAPHPDVGAAIANLAAPGYYLPVWWRKAGVVAQRLQCAGYSARDIASTMVFPVPVPEGAALEFRVTWRWVGAVQAAAAVILARFEESEAWAQSQRRATLLSIANGPTDWTTSAAIVALSEVALQTPAACIDIQDFLLGLLVKTGRSFCCFRSTLAAALLRLPTLRPELAEQLQRIG